jgi:hypothetical protein
MRAARKERRIDAVRLSPSDLAHVLVGHILADHVHHRGPTDEEWLEAWFTAHIELFDHPPPHPTAQDDEAMTLKPGTLERGFTKLLIRGDAAPLECGCITMRVADVVRS